MSGRAELYRRLPLLEADRWWLDLAADSPDGRVLELGAGTGRLTATFVDAGYEVMAVDHDEAMLAALRERLGTRVRVEHADVGALPDGAQVGLVTMPASLLNELPDESSRRAAVAGAARRCRSDGMVALELLGPWWLVRFPLRSSGWLHPADGASPVEVTMEAGAFEAWSARRHATLTYRFADGAVLRDELDAAVVTPSELLAALDAADLALVDPGEAPAGEPGLDDATWRVLARPQFAGPQTDSATSASTAAR